MVTRAFIKATVMVVSTLLLTANLPPESWARRTYFTPEQKALLEKAQTVLVTVLALTERGRADATPLLEVVKRRMEEAGYTVVTDRSVPHDVEFRVKCEERKRWTGTTREGGDADLPDAPARLWKGPACLFNYRLQGKDLGWYKEVRTDFERVREAAQAANVRDTGAYALQQLKLKLEEYDFPVIVTAEWGQEDRLIEILNKPETSKRRKLKILQLLTNIQAHEAIPYIKEIMQDPALAEEAVEALAAGGSEAIPYLTEIFQNGQSPEIRAAAAKALGNIGASTGDPRITPPLLTYLTENLKTIKTSKDIDFPVLTQVVWGLGKLRNEKSIEPIKELERKIWLIYDNSKAMKELREATNWTHKQIDLDWQVQ
ncbi:MAG: HEAT repeat domain-containing protein [Nitrospirae bacterium]|nr:MAG: HEAT repeat domain-containing protein [Nitrospirota bacterium]